MKRIIYLLLAVLLVSCAPSQVAINTAVEQTLAAKTEPAKIIAPTNSIAPTNTLGPTNTTEPTSTPKPTNTPAPTNTPVPPTETPEPVVISGNGDDVVAIENKFDIGIVHVVGNSASRFFGIVGYDKNGNMTDLFVNTTDKYDGVRPLDFEEGKNTVSFEVKANGEWIIEVLPISAARIVEVPGKIEGSGDDVVVLTGSRSVKANIKGNDEGRFFGVIGYGSAMDLLVNTTDPYDGTVMVDKGTAVLVIQAIGTWSIELFSQ
jgi:hypothetical protein